MVCMEDSMVRDAWDECELIFLDDLNCYQIDPAVFEPQVDEDFRLERGGELWEALNDIEDVSFMSEPLDGFFKGTVYLRGEDEQLHKLDVRTYTNRIKISPGDEECSFEAFQVFLEKWEENVCGLVFVGGLEEMDLD